MDLLVKVGSKKLARLLVVGDFKCMDINWGNMTVPDRPNCVQAQLSPKVGSNMSISTLADSEEITCQVLLTWLSLMRAI